MKSSPQQPFVLPARLQGSAGVRQLEALFRTRDGDLALDAGALARLDAMAVVVLRAAIEHFLGRRRGNRVWIARPRDSRACALLTHLLGELPPAADFHGGPAQPPRSRHPSVLLPAVRIRDDMHRTEISRLLEGAEQRYSRRGLVRPGALLIEAFNELVDNGLTHGRDSDVDVISACCATESDDLQVAVFDTAPQAANVPPDTRRLLAHVEHSQRKPGAFVGLVVSARYPSTLRLLAGNAGLRWRETPHLTKGDGHLPGYLAALEVHL